MLRGFGLGGVSGPKPVFREAPLIGPAAQATPIPGSTASYLPGQPPGLVALKTRAGQGWWCSETPPDQVPEDFWKKLESRPTSPKKPKPWPKANFNVEGENTLFRGQNTSILDLISGPGTLRLRARACSWYSINACWNGFFPPTELNLQDVTLNEPANLKDLRTKFLD